MIMESDHGSDFAKIEILGKLSIPPGFASLTSFFLKRDDKVKETNKSTTFQNTSEHVPTYMDAKPEMDIVTHKHILTHRPWILFDQSNHKHEESHTEHLPMDIPLSPSLPKGTIRGCPSCSDCLEVRARWHPEDARREVLEEAPIFHPTEEEFKDTLKYIASIHSRAEPYGICRIVPPFSWKPHSFLEEKNIWEYSEFVAQIQRIDGHQVKHAQETMARSSENTKSKRKRDTKVALELDSQLHNRITCNTNDQNVDDCDSQPGPKFSLKTFKKFADEFKIQYFEYKDKNKIVGSDMNSAICQKLWEPSVENIEGEYGRIVQNPTEEIEVLCGNTLDNGVFGSGSDSDSLKREAFPEYIKSGWNLKNTHSLSGSLLSFEDSDASRHFAPRIHVGMCFSTLNWKVEEHHLYSLSYMHLGEPKVWYSVPGRFAFDFETIRRKYLPDLSEGWPDDVHDKMVRQLSCSILKAEGIPVYRCLQYSREFVLVFPGAYHSGFDCGFNCSEAVSFAPLEWLLHGQDVVELYSEQKRKTFISFDKLLLGAAREAVRAQWEIDLCMKSMPGSLTHKDVYQRDGILAKALDSRVRSESFKREYLCASLKSQRMDETFDSKCRRECIICLCDLHLSAIGCSCSEDKFACLNHAKQLCSCPWSNKILLYRYEISELEGLCQALEGKLSAVYKWAKEDLGLTLRSVNSDSKRSKQSPENVSGSTGLSKDLKRKEPSPQTVLDAYSKWKQVKLQATTSIASKTKQNDVGSQVVGTQSGTYRNPFGIQSKMQTTSLKSTFSDAMKAKEKMLGCPSAATCSIGGGSKSAGIKTGMKPPTDKLKISKKVKGKGKPKVSTVSSVTKSRYMSFLQENTLDEVSSDSTSTSSSESDDT